MKINIKKTVSLVLTLLVFQNQTNAFAVDPPSPSSNKESNTDKESDYNDEDGCSSAQSEDFLDAGVDETHYIFMGTPGEAPRRIFVRGDYDGNEDNEMNRRILDFGRTFFSLRDKGDVADCTATPECGASYMYNGEVINKRATLEALGIKWGSFILVLQGDLTLKGETFWSTQCAFNQKRMSACKNLEFTSRLIFGCYNVDQLDKSITENFQTMANAISAADKKEEPLITDGRNTNIDYQAEGPSVSSLPILW